MVFTSCCLDKNVSHMLNLWEKIFNSVDLTNTERLSTILAGKAAQSHLINMLPQIGHALAVSLSRSAVSPLGLLNEVYSGLYQVSFSAALQSGLMESSRLVVVLSSLWTFARLPTLCQSVNKCFRDLDRK